MKKSILFTSLIIASFHSYASAGLAVYNCTFKNGSGKATLVYYPAKQRITWMPYEGDLKTTKANTDGSILGNGEIQFSLFGFQDQADLLLLPKEASNLPRQIDIYTYHDDDDVAVDTQSFSCSQ